MYGKEDIVKITRLNYERILLIVTVLCEIAAYLSALLLRYVILTSFYSNTDRFYSFYRVFSGVVIAVRIIIFYYYNRKGKFVPVWNQETVEIAADAIKQHMILLILLTLFLYFTRWSAGVSRTVMGFLIVLGILYDIISRILFKNYYNRHYRSLEPKVSVILIACNGETDYLRNALNRYGYVNKEKEIILECSVTDCCSPEVLNNGGELPAKQDSYIYISSRSKRLLNETARERIKAMNCPILWEIEQDGNHVLPGRVAEAGNHSVLYDSQLSQRCDVLGVNYTVTTLSEAVDTVIRSAKDLGGKYICFSNVHTTIMAHDDKQYREILNQAAFVFPDGRPVAKQIASAGYREVERVAGPDFMERMFFATANTDITHYFYGSTEETIQKLRIQLEQNYPGIKIAGMVSPPFRKLTPEEDEAAVRAINDSGASLIWIGLGAPKQEKWMAEHQDKVNGVMLGVGAGFDFHAGTIKRAPVLIQKLGLEWLYRLIQNPGRLFKRYFVTNSKFLWLTRKPEK